MVFKAKISVKINSNCFVLYFRENSLMRCNELDLYCSLPKSKKVFKGSNIKRLSEENKKRILEAKI